jgi:hypothetical protein
LEKCIAARVAEQPEKPAELKALFMWEVEENKVLPIGDGLDVGLHPQEMKRSTDTEWTLFEGMARIPHSWRLPVVLLPHGLATRAANRPRRATRCCATEEETT